MLESVLVKAKTGGNGLRLFSLTATHFDQLWRSLVESTAEVASSSSSVFLKWIHSKAYPMNSSTSAAA